MSYSKSRRVRLISRPRTQLRAAANRRPKVSVASRSAKR